MRASCMRALLLAAVLALPAGAASARQHDAEKLPITHVRDLHYGDALFYFYQDDDFTALTRLLAYEHWGRVPHHAEDAQLLEGGLYLTLGMHNEAGERFERLLTNDVPTGVRNRAWFYLAQVWYVRGYLERAAAALRKVNGRMSRARARVRLNGPYSNKALLGIGWANAALGDYQGALTPWMELRSRDVLDAAVQESYLAVPYAFGKLNANAQSAEYYENAVKSFDTETGRLDEAIARIEKGDMLERVLGTDLGVRYGWFWQLKSLPDAPESRYLYAVLAGHDFQEGLKNYRDLLYLNGTLERWGDSMGAFQDMIETRERAYAERLPRADALLASGAVAKLQRRNVTLATELRTIETQRDMAALGTTVEREQW